MQEFSTLANDLADQAREIIMSHFRNFFEIEKKSDDSPVTIADRAVEQHMREMIEKARPQDGIIGEEFGKKPSESGLNWVLDPIDGTKSFMIGRPTFGTLIGLWEGNEKPLLGIIDQAILNERWEGQDEQQTKFNGRAVSTRACPRLSQAISGCTSPAQIPEHWQQLYNASKSVVWGIDCYGYAMMASGSMDMILEDKLVTHDFAALPPIIEGAGGFISDWHGKRLTLKSSGQVLALGDTSLKEEAFSFIQSALPSE